MTVIKGDSADANMAGVVGINTVNGVGIWGEAKPNGRAIVGVADTGAGVWGATVSGRGVVGVSEAGTAIWGENKTGRAVVGAVDESGTGVWGEVKTGTGVEGVVKEGDGTGVRGRCDTGIGVGGLGATGVFAIGTDTGVRAQGATNAGFFEGNVWITRDLKADGTISAGGDIWCRNADCAEDFDVDATHSTEPGTVMVLTDEGTVRPCSTAFDTRVAGVISGAGDYRPGIVLDRRDSASMRKPVALMGKVFCKVETSAGPIEIGDLLTTSDTPGHARRADDPIRAFGAVIGKALQPLREGSGLIPILVTLQ